MSNSSKEFFEKISRFCYVSKTPYFFKNGSNEKDKFFKGVFTVYEWVDELCYYYLKQEKNLKSDFLSLLEKKRREIKRLPNGKYKNGMLKGFDEIDKILNDL